MRVTTLPAPILCALAATGATAPTAEAGGIDSFAEFAWREPSRDDIEWVRAHVRFLADDLLEGRAPGTRGGEVAARYLASQLEALGVEPGGDGGTYFQKVPLLGVTADYASSTAAIVRAGAEAGTIPLAWLDDFVAIDESQRESSSIDAEIVF